MKRTLGLLLIALLALTLTGCGAAGSTQAGGETSSTPTTTPPPVVPVAKSWKAIPMGVQEKARLATLGRAIALYTAAETKAGRTPVALADKTPRFVGYQVQVWTEHSAVSYDIGFLDVIDGRIDSIGDLQVPLRAEMLGLRKNQTSRRPSNVVPMSAGEKSAVAKAAAWAAAAFPGSTWNAEISGYDFYYKLSGGKYILFTAAAANDGYRALAGPMRAPKK
jgi:hypothetical protein